MPRGRVEYFSGLLRANSSGQVSARIFAYVRDRASGDAWLKALSEIDCVAIVVAPYLSQQETKEHSQPNITLVNQPVDLLQVLPQADAVMSYGSVTLACRSLLLGKPQLIMPVDMEKCLFANRIALAGAAHVVPSGNILIKAVIEEILSTKIVKEAAQNIAKRYLKSSFENSKLAFIDAMSASIRCRDSL